MTFRTDFQIFRMVFQEELSRRTLRMNAQDGRSRIGSQAGWTLRRESQYGLSGQTYRKDFQDRLSGWTFKI